MTLWIFSMRARGAALAVSIVLAGCAVAQLHDDGMRLVSAGEHDAALGKLREANRLEPSNAQYRIDLLKEIDAYSRDLARRGNEAASLGKLDEAGGFYRKALAVDGSNERARQGLAALEAAARSAKRTADAERLERDGELDAAHDALVEALADNPANAAAQRRLAALRDKQDKAREVSAARSAAQSVMSRPVTLQFREANLRMVFEALSRTTGLNVILDRDVRSDLKTTIFVKDAAVEDTVDLILLQNQLEKRTLNANTLFIYPATAAKQKEYQDLEVRSFQVVNADVKYLQTVLKTVLKIKELTVDERSSTIVMRDTPDAIAVAAKVIAAHDVPEPEVMLEVEVLEISHDRLTNLGLQFPESITLSTPTDASGGALTLGALRALKKDNLLVSPLSLGINLKLQDTDANLLASPRIRARNKEKARILIGDRVPIITNTVTPVASGSGVVTGSVQYQDVGLKLEFEPQIYSEQEVGIRISLEVSTIAKEISGPNGSLAYQIGTRNAQTVLRLRDGETQVLGGLISSEDRNTAAKVPGLGQMPVVGRLFANNSGNAVKTEIVLSITPHILRPPATVDHALSEVFSGTEGIIRQRALRLDPVGAAGGQSTVSGAAPAPAVPGFSGGGGATPPAAPRPANGASMRSLLPLMNGGRNAPGAGAAASAAPPAESAASAPEPAAPAASEPGVAP